MATPSHTLNESPPGRDAYEQYPRKVDNTFDPPWEGYKEAGLSISKVQERLLSCMATPSHTLNESPPGRDACSKTKKHLRCKATPSHTLNESPPGRVTEKLILASLRNKMLTSTKTFDCSKFSDEIYKLMSHVYSIMKDDQLNVPSMKLKSKCERLAELLNNAYNAA
ncbi:hypothetical protein EDC96DRAFT_543199 [Choanephora cucurbitarum]|nr:hypothetical protein EDC96DRAFT_543199 [Choanephora cucurbitarum]